MSKGKTQDRTPYPPDELQWLWDGLAGKSCPVCFEALDNGSEGVRIERNGLFRHIDCVRPAKQWEGPVRKPRSG